MWSERRTTFADFSNFTYTFKTGFIQLYSWWKFCLKKKWLQSGRGLFGFVPLCIKRALSPWHLPNACIWHWDLKSESGTFPPYPIHCQDSCGKWLNVRSQTALLLRTGLCSDAQPNFHNFFFLSVMCPHYSNRSARYTGGVGCCQRTRLI